ncbi:NAD-dependent succinate-semialdehyde dehydrogenase [Thauera sp.]|jgi:succinate-semialdehyde dehydrogenase/glutarate-semialdehyde dehydrogenase|uniref:NAD-dependent succinate-semialdehyde dehydrogenase n=1 Tax=Thauera sp. TaxID=1905334 RepID=UPI002BD5772D|nr:NAD-dependent succinate-semialdehyde dehydrogenase [Thauera sp.]HRO36787.1 NAD-dependent succinate-semialdehyde dehydrogenase [Thauera sp.]
MGKHLLKDPGLWKAAALIDGEWVSETAHGTYDLHNPATGELLVKLPRCKEAETTAAIEAADRAYRAWRRTTARHRSEVVRRWYELVVAAKEDLATLITLEEGKPLAEARGEVDYAASFLQWFAEEAKRVRGDVIPAPKDSQRIMALRQPVGVCAAITPWNFPAAMITRKAGPALAAGCSVVVKPASQTPLTALALGELALRAGVPAGVYSVVTGNDTRAIGGTLTSHPLVRKVTFTGSTEVGRVLLRQSAETIKKCSMELGGNAPLIVFDDADLELAVEGVMNAKYRNTGQSCIAANRVLVQDGIHDALAARLAERSRALKVGNGLEAGVQIGPMIDEAAVAKVEEHLANAVAGGAQVLAGGKRHALGGAFFEPTVVTGVTRDMTIAREETFGPLMPLLRFKTDAEAIEMANDSEFGLAAYLFSKDAARVWRTAEALESGMVGVNTGLISSEVAPFGGIKQSGLGREGSQYGIDEYVEIKYVCWDGLSPMP